MKIGSLFSGIGGLELGLERSGLGKTVWQVEINPFCQRVLAQHWPEAKCYSDITTLDAKTLPQVDVICGGFPCQDVSSAGSRKGLAGARSGLWYQFARIVQSVHPRWVVVENVASGATLWVDTVASQLEQFGYETLPIPLSASDVGAPYFRRRVFIIARHIDSERQSSVSVNAKMERASKSDDATDAYSLLLRQQPGRGGRSKRTQTLESASACVAGAASIVDSSGLQGKRQRAGSSGSKISVPPRRASEARRENHWATEPRVVRMVSRLPNRVDRITALGNCVVPQCAEVIGHIIQFLDNA